MNYAAFVRSYFRWYNRMTDSDASPNYTPNLFLSTLQALNLACISCVLLPKAIPTWMILTAAGLVLLVMYGRNRAIIDSIAQTPRFSRWSDNVPGLREFSAVYAYLAFSMALLFLPVFLGTSS